MIRGLGRGPTRDASSLSRWPAQPTKLAPICAPLLAFHCQRQQEEGSCSLQQSRPTANRVTPPLLLFNPPLPQSAAAQPPPPPPRLLDQGLPSSSPFAPRKSRAIDEYFSPRPLERLGGCEGPARARPAFAAISPPRRRPAGSLLLSPSFPGASRRPMG